MSAPRSKPPAPNSAAAQADAAMNEDVPRPLRRKEDLQIEEVLDKQADRGLRDVYSQKAYELAADCIHFWIFLVLANALILALLDKQVVSDTVLIAVTTGVTVNVLAAFLGVIRGLFPLQRSK